MTPSFVAGASTAELIASGSPATVPLPAGIQVGDLLLLAPSTNGGTFPTVTTPTGWAQVANTSTRILYKVADAGDVSAGSVALTYSTTNNKNKFATVAYRGVDTTTPIRGAAVSTVFSGSPASALTFPTVTGAVAGDKVLRIAATANNTAATEINFAAATERLDTSTLSASFALVGVGDQDQASSGATGTTTAAIVKTSDHTTAQAVWGFEITIVLTPAAASAPTNTVAPAVTGTSKVGQPLSCSTGTWTNSPSSFAYQWKRDGTAISGATASAYTLASADAGHAITCEVTATNGAGASSPAVSNTITVPGAPVNTTAPHITPATGPWHTADVLTCTAGTWTNSPDTYSFQWFRGVSPITGATSSTYTLAVTDEGASITCRVTADNGLTQTASSDDTIVPTVTAAISDASMLIYYSGPASGNTDPAQSIGGVRAGTYPGGLNNLFPRVPGTVGQNGGHYYRVVYVRNTHTISTFAGAVAFLAQQLSHAGLQLAFAVPNEGVNTAVAALASGTTDPFPSNPERWSTATDAGTGLAFGDLGPSQYRGLYVRLTVAPGTTLIAEDDFDIAVAGSAA